MQQTHRHSWGRKQVHTEPETLSQLLLQLACIPAFWFYGKPFLYNEVPLICLSTSNGSVIGSLVNVVSPNNNVVVSNLYLPLFSHLIQEGLSLSITSHQSRNDSTQSFT